MAQVPDPRRRRSTPPRDVALARLAGEQHGVVSLAQLREAGIGERAAQHRAAAGTLHRLHRGVYAVGHTSVSPDGRRLAAVLACGSGSALTRRSAGAAWAVCPDASRWWEVVAPRTRRHPPEGVRLFTARWLPPEHVTLLRGIPVTTVARTLVDLSTVLNDHRLERAIHEAEVLRLLDVRAVVDIADGLRGRQGVARLRRVLGEPSAGVTRSELEERFVALCRASALPMPRLNVVIEGNLEVDALWPAARVVVELDGAAVHQSRRAFYADRRRDARLVAAGYAVLRFTWRDVVDEPDRVVAQVHATLAARGGAG